MVSSELWNYGRPPGEAPEFSVCVLGPRPNAQVALSWGYSRTLSGASSQARRTLPATGYAGGFHRSIPLRFFEPLARVPGVRLGC